MCTNVLRDPTTACIVTQNQEIQGNHLPVCPKYPVSCLNKCGVSPLKRDQLEDHLRECPLQLVECELREIGCEEMVKRGPGQTHGGGCSETPDFNGQQISQNSS